MMVSMRERVRTGSMRHLLLFVILILAAQGSSGRAGYHYQFRHTLHPPHIARFNHVSLRLGDDRVGVFEGFGQSSIEIFDPTTEEFTMSRVNQWFGDFSAVVLPDGNALIVDGERDCVYDYLTDHCSVTGNAYTGGYIRSPVLVPLPNGRIFICGGADIDCNPVTTCGFFDPRTRRFSAAGDLSIPRTEHTAVLIDDHRVLVAGGYDYDASIGFTTLDSLEIYDTDAGRSAPVRTSLLHGRYSHCAAKLPDGRVIFFGGSSFGAELRLRSVEIFDPATSTIVEGPALGLKRRIPEIAWLPSGRIAVFSGEPQARTAEIYCPQTGTFELAQNLMLEPRWIEFSATNLASGAVLLVGGRIGDGLETAGTAEIFEETAAQTPVRPGMTAASIREFLTDPDPNVVNETLQWLVNLGPQVRPLLETLTLDAHSDVALQAESVIQSIDSRNYPQIWCAEIWNASNQVDTVWLDSFECPEYYSTSYPHKHFTALLRATEGVEFTHLVVRFPVHVPYGSRVELFNLAGWPPVERVTLGEDLSRDDLQRAGY